ncbi:MAG: hypothetical protein ACRDRP_05670 [Pseudonocardiaceae bacterium]
MIESLWQAACGVGNETWPTPDNTGMTVTVFGVRAEFDDALLVVAFFDFQG